MNSKRLLAYITGSVDQVLLNRNEYHATENRIFRNQLKGRLRLTDDERISLAEIGKRLPYLVIVEKTGVTEASLRQPALRAKLPNCSLETEGHFRAS